MFVKIVCHELKEFENVCVVWVSCEDDGNGVIHEPFLKNVYNVGVYGPVYEAVVVFVKCNEALGEVR